MYNEFKTLYAGAFERLYCHQEFLWPHTISNTPGSKYPPAVNDVATLVADPARGCRGVL